MDSLWLHMFYKILCYNNTIIVIVKEKKVIWVKSTVHFGLPSLKYRGLRGDMLQVYKSLKEDNIDYNFITTEYKSIQH